MDAYIHTVIIKLTWISKGIYIYIFIYIMLYNNKKRGGRGGGGGLANDFRENRPLNF